MTTVTVATILLYLFSILRLRANRFETDMGFAAYATIVTIISFLLLVFLVQLAIKYLP